MQLLREPPVDVNLAVSNNDKGDHIMKLNRFLKLARLDNVRRYLNGSRHNRFIVTICVAVVHCTLIYVD